MSLLVIFWIRGDGQGFLALLTRALGQQGMRLGHHITQQNSANKKLVALGSIQREPLAWKANNVLRMGTGGTSAGGSPGSGLHQVGAEERRGQAVQTVQRTDWLWERLSQPLGTPEMAREYLEGKNAVRQAGGGCANGISRLVTLGLQMDKTEPVTVFPYRGQWPS